MHAANHTGRVSDSRLHCPRRCVYVTVCARRAKSRGCFLNRFQVWFQASLPGVLLALTGVLVSKPLTFITRDRHSQAHEQSHLNTVYTPGLLSSLRLINHLLTAGIYTILSY